MSNYGNKETLGRNLSRYADKTGKSHIEIATELGVTVSSFNGWCRGEYYPRIDKIEKMAKYFGCTKADLVEEEDTTFTVSKEAKQYVDIVSANAKRREVVDYICRCDEEDLEFIISVTKQLERKSKND